MSVSVCLRACEQRMPTPLPQARARTCWPTVVTTAATPAPGSTSPGPRPTARRPATFAVRVLLTGDVLVVMFVLYCFVVVVVFFVVVFFLGGLFWGVCVCVCVCVWLFCLLHVQTI